METNVLTPTTDRMLSQNRKLLPFEILFSPGEGNQQSWAHATTARTIWRCFSPRDKFNYWEFGVLPKPIYRQLVYHFYDPLLKGKKVECHLFDVKPVHKNHHDMARNLFWLEIGHDGYGKIWNFPLILTMKIYCSQKKVMNKKINIFLVAIYLLIICANLF